MDSNNDIGSTPPPIEDEPNFEERLKRFSEGVGRREQKEHEERIAFMATQPQAMPCRFHPGVLRPIDEQATKDAMRFRQFLPEGEPRAGYARCPKCVQAEMNRDLEKFGVPGNLVHATFENFIPANNGEADFVGIMKEFCGRKTGFLILSGNYGTGKTHLAVAAIRQFNSGWFVKQGTLLRLLRATYGDRDAADPVDKAQGARLLVLDDAGLSSGGRDELPMLHEVLDYRHGERLPTIVTTNLPFEQLSDALGERMADRLRESTFRILTFNGSSHRREAREHYFEPGL